MRLILFDAFLAACIATITAEFLSDGSLSSDQSLFQEELPQDLSWNDPETLIPSAEYDVFGGDLFAPQDISSSTTDLALSRLDAPLCLLNEGVQAPSRKARVRRDEGTSGSSCDAVSKPWHPSGETSEQPGKFDENIWKEFMGSPGDNQPEPEDPSTLFPILKDPKDENEKCPREFPKHLCCGERGPQESFNLLQPIYARMYQCEIGKYCFSLPLLLLHRHSPFPPSAPLTFRGRLKNSTRWLT